VRPRTTSPNYAPAPARASAPDPSHSPDAGCVVPSRRVCRALAPGVSCPGAGCVADSGASPAWTVLSKHCPEVTRSPDLKGVIKPRE
jgi:hypothetical protein